MKTIEEIKNLVAARNNYGNYFRALTSDEQSILIDLVATEFAKQCCDEQIKECCNNASIKQENEYIDSLTGYAIVSRIDEDSILNTPNVVTTKS